MVGYVRSTYTWGICAFNISMFMLVRELLVQVASRHTGGPASAGSQLLQSTQVPVYKHKLTNPLEAEGVPSILTHLSAPLPPTPCFAFIYHLPPHSLLLYTLPSTATSALQSFSYTPPYSMSAHIPPILFFHTFLITSALSSLSASHPRRTLPPPSPPTTIPSHILLLLLTRLPHLTSYYAQSTLSIPPLSLLFTPIRPPYSPRLLSRPYQQPLTHPIHTLLHHIFSPILYSHANLSTSHSLPLPSPITLLLLSSPSRRFESLLGHC